MVELSIEVLKPGVPLGMIKDICFVRSLLRISDVSSISNLGNLRREWLPCRPGDHRTRHRQIFPHEAK